MWSALAAIRPDESADFGIIQIIKRQYNPSLMRLRLVSILAVVSLFLCAATIVLWLLSYSIAVHIELGAADLIFEHGHAFGYFTCPTDGGPNGFDGPFDIRQEPPENFWLWLADDYRQAPITSWRWLGIRASRHSYSDFGLQYQLAFHLWWLVASCAAIPLAKLFVSFRDRRRRDAFACTSCGYDLRATPDRCPECGAIATQGSV